MFDKRYWRTYNIIAGITHRNPPLRDLGDIVDELVGKEEGAYIKQMAQAWVKIHHDYAGDLMAWYIDTYGQYPPPDHIKSDIITGLTAIDKSLGRSDNYVWPTHV